MSSSISKYEFSSFEVTESKFVNYLRACAIILIIVGLCLVLLIIYRFGSENEWHLFSPKAEIVIKRFGNILTILNSTENTCMQVDRVLDSNDIKYFKLINTYYLETIGGNTSKIIDDLKGLDIKFVFFHNSIPDHSQIICFGLDNKDCIAINRILFK